MSTPKDAVAQFAARFAFDKDTTGAFQQELAQGIEAAIADFKAGDYHDIIKQTLEIALRRRIDAAIDGWSRAYHGPQPLEAKANEVVS